MGAARGFAVDCDNVGVAVTQTADPAMKHSENNFGFSALIKSLSASWLGMPSLYGRKRRRKSMWAAPHCVISTKSSAPTMVAHRTSSRISGSG